MINNLSETTNAVNKLCYSNSNIHEILLKHIVTYEFSLHFEEKVRMLGSLLEASKRKLWC